jgi:hypothetical protein
MEKETVKISTALSKFQQSEEHYKKVDGELQKTEERYKNLSRHHLMAKYQLKSLLSTFINLFEYIIFLPSNKQNIKNEEQLATLKQIKEGLIEKLQGIAHSFNDIELSCEISQVKNWKFHSHKYSFDRELSMSLLNKTRNTMMDTQASSNTSTIILKEDVPKEEEKKLLAEIMVMK